MENVAQPKLGEAYEYLSKLADEPRLWRETGDESDPYEVSVPVRALGVVLKQVLKLGRDSVRHEGDVKRAELEATHYREALRKSPCLCSKQFEDCVRCDALGFIE